MEHKEISLLNRERVMFHKNIGQCIEIPPRHSIAECESAHYGCYLGNSSTGMAASLASRSGALYSIAYNNVDPLPCHTPLNPLPDLCNTPFILEGRAYGTLVVLNHLLAHDTASHEQGTCRTERRRFS